MNAHVLYRVATVLLMLFAAGHTLGFRQRDPQWGVDSLVTSMRSLRFDIQGFKRTYWDFFAAAGFSTGACYLFAALVAWQLSGLPSETLKLMRLLEWAFAVSFAMITLINWRYLFIVPIAFSSVITLCLAWAAWCASRSR
jgi:hypothetical protein